MQDPCHWLHWWILAIGFTMPVSFCWAFYFVALWKMKFQCNFYLYLWWPLWGVERIEMKFWAVWKDGCLKDCWKKWLFAMPCGGDASVMLLLRSTTPYVIACSAYNLDVFLWRDADSSSKSWCMAKLWLCFELTSDKGSRSSQRKKHSWLAVKAINLLAWRALLHFVGPTVPCWPQEAALCVLFWWT